MRYPSSNASAIDCIARTLAGVTLQIYHQKLLTNKNLANSCLFAFFINFMLRDILKFGEPPVTRQIRHGFPPPNIRAIWYSLVPRSQTAFYNYTKEKSVTKELHLALLLKIHLHEDCYSFCFNTSSIMQHELKHYLVAIATYMPAVNKY